MITELHGRVIINEAELANARVTIREDGIIASIELEDGPCAESTIAPAFFDVHVHGAAGRDVMDGSAESLGAVSSFLATRGVGHFFATTVTASLDATLRALDGIAMAIDSTAETANGASIAGIHLEGPFLSHGKRGVHPVDSLLEPSIELFERMWQAARGHIRLMTVAPELPGALELIRHASGRGVRISLGHSDATAEEARAGIAAGAVSATHTFNAMRRLDHREPGLAGIVLDSEELYAELICDGIHVAPEFIRLWARMKGADRAILVTDGISATGMPDGEYDLGGLNVAVSKGRCLLASDLKRGVETLAGSVLTMDAAVENVRRFGGVSIAESIRMATTTPARMAGLSHLAELTVGSPATLNVFQADGTLARTWIGGHVISR
jgi:N-acetylglucosamine-6-phosphate deacetylase